MPRSQALVWLALAATLIIWASFLVAARAAMTSPLGVIEIGLLRFGVGALCFAPWLLRHGVLPKGAGWRELLGIAMAGGAVFILLLASGLGYAPVADSGVFTPSMLPLFVTLFALALGAPRPTGLQALGLALIVTGALAVGGWSALAEAGDGRWRGHLLFLGASASWAVYTLAFRASSLSPVQAGGMIAFWSLALYVPAALIFGTGFASVPASLLLTQVVFQGILSGFVATFTYFYVVRALGPTRTAAFAALVPVLAALGGAVFLGEPVGTAKAAGIAVTACGVALASGAFTFAKAPRPEDS